MHSIQGNIVDIHTRRIFQGKITYDKGKIHSVEPAVGTGRQFILCGFVDAHVHIESSMLVPTEFARLALPHGTVATVSDPHEIANVVGAAGVQFMIENGKRSPLKFCFGAPSCVPATAFETAGAALDAKAVEALLKSPDIYYLSEMMNFPGVLFSDGEVMAKIAAAKRIGKPIDGHAPGLRGEEAKRYFAAGISTDHECFSYEEGLEKARLGVKILIREGSAAKNFEALIPLLMEFPKQVMFCSDDKHPDELLDGHINRLVARAVARGYDLYDVLWAACVHPVEHYGLPVGLLREGDAADFIVVKDLVNFEVLQTHINGDLVAENGKAKQASISVAPINNFNINPLQVADFQCVVKSVEIRCIHALDGQLITKSSIEKVKIEDGFAFAEVERDLLKFTVVNRYENAAPALAFIKGFGLKRGAIASCVGHDSHNILAVGADDESLCRAVNLIVENKGGISAVDGLGAELVLPLPIAGILSDAKGEDVAAAYSRIDEFSKKNLGSTLASPFMTLSFMALTVIPELKLSDKGLFDGKAFAFTELFV